MPPCSLQPDVPQAKQESVLPQRGAQQMRPADAL